MQRNHHTFAINVNITQIKGEEERIVNLFMVNVPNIRENSDLMDLAHVASIMKREKKNAD